MSDTVDRIVYYPYRKGLWGLLTGTFRKCKKEKCAVWSKGFIFTDPITKEKTVFTDACHYGQQTIAEFGG